MLVDGGLAGFAVMEQVESPEVRTTTWLLIEGESTRTGKAKRKAKRNVVMVMPVAKEDGPTLDAHMAGAG